MFLHIFLDQDYSGIRIVQGFDSMSNTRNDSLFCFALLHELLGRQLQIEGLAEHPRRIVQGAAEAGTNRGQSRDQRRHQILSRPRGHNGVVRTRDAGTVVGSGDHAELNELAEIGRQASPEPQQTDGAPNAQLLIFGHFRDGNTCISGFSPSIIADGADDVRGLSHQSLLLQRVVIAGQLRHRGLSGHHDGTCLHQDLIHCRDQIAKFVKASRDVGACFGQGPVLGAGRFLVSSRAGARMAELHLVVEGFRRRAAAPGH
mmetsp:Transcript_69818/g.153984  ORF Transcript_69818/g.153984 Transcript_69818/m.153984 type:complete len:259 (-) Transcript_69818:363-1139(-)